MNIVLVCLTNFQDYILTNIEQLIKLNHSSIYVITNERLFTKFALYKEHINLINSDELTDSYNYESKSTMNKEFRNGFWRLTSQRFFYLHAFMKKYNIYDIIHLENDVLIYYNCNELLKCIDNKCVYLPFDTYKRNIASIMYIPNSDTLGNILDLYDYTKNDMDNFAAIQQNTGLIKNFPIFKGQFSVSNEETFVSSNSDVFPYIFDAAAIGQYLGGIDPRNTTCKSTIGFINETCVIKYNKYKFIYKMVDEIKKPFIVINQAEFPIFNLHIHSKQLKCFV